MLTYRFKYFILFLILLAIELFIALKIKDNFIRPYLGDVIVVVLIYTFIRSFSKIGIRQSLIIVLVFSFFIEFTQGFHLIEILNLEQYNFAHWVLGRSFNWWDFVAYTFGLAFVLLAEVLFMKKINKPTLRS